MPTRQINNFAFKKDIKAACDLIDRTPSSLG
jgi:hypothetical protein